MFDCRATFPACLDYPRTFPRTSYSSLHGWADLLRVQSSSCLRIIPRWSTERDLSRSRIPSCKQTCLSAQHWRYECWMESDGAPIFPSPTFILQKQISPVFWNRTLFQRYQWWSICRWTMEDQSGTAAVLVSGFGCICYQTCFQNIPLPSPVLVLGCHWWSNQLETSMEHQHPRSYFINSSGSRRKHNSLSIWWWFYAWTDYASLRIQCGPLIKSSLISIDSLESTWLVDLGRNPNDRPKLPIHRFDNRTRWEHSQWYAVFDHNEITKFKGAQRQHVYFLPLLRELYFSYTNLTMYVLVVVPAFEQGKGHFRRLGLFGMYVVAKSYPSLITSLSDAKLLADKSSYQEVLSEDSNGVPQYKITLV